MNRLSNEKQALILSHLVEGMSVRSIERITGVHRDTILRLLVSAASVAREVMDSQFMNLEIKRLEVDELWGIIAKKQKRVRRDDPKEFGDVWTYVAFDPDSKMIPAWRVGKRTGQLAVSLMSELNVRIRSRFQLTTDSFAPYANAVDRVFGDDIDYAQLHKEYSIPENVKQSATRYSPGKLCALTIKPMTGSPVRKFISTSGVERQNLTMRMSMRRLTRLTNAFSKKLENFEAAITLHVFHYNFLRVHRSLRVTPAMEAKVASHIWNWEDLFNYQNQSQAA